jgi:hypothetical protein
MALRSASPKSVQTLKVRSRWRERPTFRRSAHTLADFIGGALELRVETLEPVDRRLERAVGSLDGGNELTRELCVRPI